MMNEVDSPNDGADPPVEQPSDSEQEEAYVVYLGPRAVYPNEYKGGGFDHRLTITDAIETAGFTREDAKQMSLRFQTKEYTGEDGAEQLGILPAAPDLGRSPDGRSNSLWRSVQVTGTEGNPAYSVSIPDAVLEAFGYDPEDSRGELIEVFASDGVLAFDKVETRDIELESDIDIIRDVLPPQAAQDYEAVVVEGKDPAEWAEERGMQEGDSGFDPKHTVKRNVKRAKEILDSLNSQD